MRKGVGGRREEDRRGDGDGRGRGDGDGRGMGDGDGRGMGGGWEGQWKGGYNIVMLQLLAILSLF